MRRWARQIIAASSTSFLMTSSRPFRAARANAASVSAMSPRKPSTETLAHSSTATPSRSSVIVTSGRILLARSMLVRIASSSSVYMEMNAFGSRTKSAFLRRTSSLARSSSLGKSE